MKKFYTEIRFSFTPLFRGIKGGNYIPLEEENREWYKDTKTSVFLPKLPKSEERITLLTDEQLSAVFEEGDGDVCHTLEDLKETFTFVAYRRRGCDKDLNKPWVALSYNQGEIEPEEAVCRSRFVLAQLARFGVIDKLRLAP